MIDICSLHPLFLLSLFLHITADTLLVPTCLHTLAHLFSTLHRCWLSTAGTQNPPLYLSLLPTTSPFHLGSSRSHTILSRCCWPSLLGFPGQTSPPHYRSQCHPQTSRHHNSPWRFRSTLVCSVMCNSRSHTVRPRGVCITNRGGVEVFQSYTHTQPTLCFHSASHLVLFCPVLKFEYYIALEHSLIFSFFKWCTSTLVLLQVQVYSALIHPNYNKQSL